MSFNHQFVYYFIFREQLVCKMFTFEYGSCVVVKGVLYPPLDKDVDGDIC